MLLKQLQSLSQFAYRLVLWIYPVNQVIHNQWRVIVDNSSPILFHNSARNADNSTVCGNIFVYNGICAHLAVIADRNWPKYFGSHTDQHAIPERGMPLNSIQTGTTKSYLMIHQYVITDDSGLTNYDAHAVVDEKSPSDGSARVDLNSGTEPRELRHHSRRKFHSPFPQRIRKVVKPEGMQPWIGQYLQNASCGRIFGKDSMDVLAETVEHVLVFSS